MSKKEKTHRIHGIIPCSCGEYFYIGLLFDGDNELILVEEGVYDLDWGNLNYIHCDSCGSICAFGLPILYDKKQPPLIEYKLFISEEPTNA